jgi:hypothetical protein
MRVIYVLLLLCIGMTVACKKSKLMLYEGGQTIYFEDENTYSKVYVDTAYYNFGTSEIKSDTLFKYVWVMGSIVDHKRPFKIRVVKENTTAVEGRDYELPIADSLYIPANSRQQRLPIILHRTSELFDKEVKLEIELVENNLFNTNMKVHNNYASAYTPSATKIRFTIADRLPKPPVWDANFGALGSYSRKKFTMFVENQELDYSRWYSKPFYSNSSIKYYASEFQYYLNEERDNGNIILDEDGKEMKMGILAQ